MSTDEVSNHRTDKRYLPGVNRLEMKSKSGTGVFARPGIGSGGRRDFGKGGRPAQRSVPRGFLQLVPPPYVRDRGRRPVMVAPAVPSGMKMDYTPPPEETPTEFLPEDQETMSPYPDDDRFMLLTRHPKMINGRWIEYPPILIPKKDRIHECVLEEEPPWTGMNDLDIVSEPCDICGGKYGKHDCTACPLRERCLPDEEVGKDFEVVCLFHAIPNCPHRCSGNFGRAAFKITKPLT
ncbi:hypothetical protein CASFOL_011173 [Castilleja foliolosa]|uniref:Uncharacterized protein n=1 Tax=Castilleja foliolosa TaxID=1961234 RepID=A0ABD3DV55_9LAMI